MIERAMIESKGRTLIMSLPASSNRRNSGRMTIQELERQHIHEVLEKTNWRIRGKNGAAEILGLHPSTLYARMKKLGIERPAAPSIF